MSISENIAAIRKRMDAAAINPGRDSKSILLCAATKMNDADNVRTAISAGVDCCGENRVQELITKSAQNAYEGAPLHFIGHLQTNKVKYVVGKVDLIQSVDSLRLLNAIQQQAHTLGIIQNILLEINIANEDSKSGFSVSELYDILPKIRNFPNLLVQGLMAIPPICHNPGENDKFFQEMYNLSVDITGKKYDNVCVRFLSMGMSDDFECAIAHGSNMIRVGTAIFGARDYSKTSND